MSFCLMMIGGMALDLLLGWPERLYLRIGHPVTWFGRTIGALENHLNTGSRGRRLTAGAITAVLVTLLAALPAVAVQAALPDTWTGVMIGSVLAWPLIASRSLHEHVVAVARQLEAHDLPAARNAVSMIVGRDASSMDSAAVARAATESLAENTSDGVVAPLFWGAILGLPGIFAYKAINTMDSMIGHRTNRFEAFGKTAARMDDVANWLPARMTGITFACLSGRPVRAVGVMLRDASKHRSPNAGWPEGAMAAALGVRLSGPRMYGGHIAEEPWLNEGAPDLQAGDLGRALSIYRCAVALFWVVLVGLALL
ncbi:MAG: adenosylcobinamide-phosphate synthase CbiB [Candidatus Phaeomarinobacter sp.]